MTPSETGSFSSNSSDCEFIFENVAGDNLSEHTDKTQKIKEKIKYSFSRRMSSTSLLTKNFKAKLAIFSHINIDSIKIRGRK